MTERDIYGQWRRALVTAVGRLEADAQLTSAAEEVKQIELLDGRSAIIYVKVIGFSEDKLQHEPDSGGLLAEL